MSTCLLTSTCIWLAEQCYSSKLEKRTEQTSSRLITFYVDLIMASFLHPSFFQNFGNLSINHKFGQSHSRQKRETKTKFLKEKLLWLSKNNLFLKSHRFCSKNYFLYRSFTTLDCSTFTKWMIGGLSHQKRFLLFKMRQAISRTSAAPYKLMKPLGAKLRMFLIFFTLPCLTSLGYFAF